MMFPTLATLSGILSGSRFHGRWTGDTRFRSFGVKSIRASGAGVARDSGVW